MKQNSAGPREVGPDLAHVWRGGHVAAQGGAAGWQLRTTAGTSALSLVTSLWSRHEAI